MNSTIRGKTVQVLCRCGAVFTARLADIKRGWAKSCSKSCAAKRSNKETGKFDKYLKKIEARQGTHRIHPADVLGSTFSNEDYFDRHSDDN